MGLIRSATSTSKVKGLSLLLLAAFNTFAKLQAQQVRIDEDFSDWSKVPILLADKKGDGGFLSIDFDRITVANDSLNLYFYLELGREMNIQSSNNLRLNIDLDDSALTGIPNGGLGIDLQYNFGAKK